MDWWSRCASALLYGTSRHHLDSAPDARWASSLGLQNTAHKTVWKDRLPFVSSRVSEASTAALEPHTKGAGHGKGITFVGMDAHKVAIKQAVLLPERREPVEWQLANEKAAVRRMVRKVQRLAPGEVIQICSSLSVDMESAVVELAQDQLTSSRPLARPGEYRVMQICIKSSVGRAAA